MHVRCVCVVCWKGFYLTWAKVGGKVVERALLVVVGQVLDFCITPWAACDRFPHFPFSLGLSPPRVANLAYQIGSDDQRTAIEQQPNYVLAGKYTPDVKSPTFSGISPKLQNA